MHILARNGTVGTYPYSIGQLRADNPQTSFPKNPTDALLATYGVFPVATVGRPAYDVVTQNIEESTPALVNGVWTQVWKITSASESEINERKASVAANVRHDRDNRLSESDWVAIKAVERGEAVPAAWAAYRQALRDITGQPGFPLSVTWPTKPE